MPDTQIRLFKPTNPGSPLDFYSFYNDLIKAINDSLSTAGFASPGVQGVIYRHPYIPVGTPALNQVPVWNGKVYVPGVVPTGSLTLTGDVTGLANNNVVGRIQKIPFTTSTPTDGQVATYDAVSNSIVWDDPDRFTASKNPAKYATTAALPSNTYLNGVGGIGATLTGVAFGALSIDGNTPSIGDRVLVKNEATAANNGLYNVTVVGGVATLFILTRTLDMDQSDEIAGAMVPVTSGATLSNTLWLAGPGPYTIGTTAVNFTQISATPSGPPSSITFLANKSATKTPAASGNWNSASATITLTPGTWLVNAMALFFNSGTAAGYATQDYVLSIADGANSGSRPTGISTSGNVTLKGGQPDPKSILNSPVDLVAVGGIGYLVAEQILVAVSTNTPIYMVPMATMSTPANSRIVTDIWALKVSTATS